MRPILAGGRFLLERTGAAPLLFVGSLSRSLLSSSSRPTSTKRCVMLAFAARNSRGGGITFHPVAYPPYLRITPNERLSLARSHMLFPHNRGIDPKQFRLAPEPRAIHVRSQRFRLLVGTRVASAADSRILRLRRRA